MITYDEYKRLININHGKALAICSELSTENTVEGMKILKQLAAEIFAEHEQIKVADVQF